MNITKIKKHKGYLIELHQMIDFVKTNKEAEKIKAAWDKKYDGDAISITKTIM